MALRLSLHDRIAQLIVVRGYGDYLNSQSAEYRRLAHWIRDVHVGGMIVANRVHDGRVINAQPYEMAVFLNHLQRLARTPLFFGSDFERGASMRVAETARYPYMMAYGAAHDLNAVRDLGAATAREARALGITWVFAPDADVNNNPDNPIINTRSFGEDPQAVAQNVTAFIEGAHADPGNYVLLSAKHFPGHGDTAEDSHMQMAKLDQPKERIESVELVPFRAAIAHGVDSIMTAHLSVPAFEPRPIPATVSKNILTGLLREQMGFKGLIVTDAMDMQGLTALFSQGEAAARAIEAGADVLLMPADPEACIRGVMEAVRKGRISQRRINESAAKVLAAKRRVGLYRSRFVSLDKIADRIKDPSLDELAQKVADESVTLVKDDKHLFPIGDPANACLTVLTEGRYSSRGQNLINTALRRAPNLRTYVANATTPDAELNGLTEALSKCKQVYIGAFVTATAYRGSVALEGGLSSFISSLIKAKAPVGLISFGSPYLLRSFPGVSAYAATFSISNTSEIAAAKALFGEIPIQGKLPVSIPGLAKIGDGIRVTTRTSRASQGMQ
ncbi:MAG TPA: glycoside hydrolase family 3 N-terminal domain-containing protein [Bryobacteraceae bacterium]|nr:glycoside hydrolase family 3 N-terminal domain-containing protein [Bryobacteraceae bacterium]